MVGFGENDDPEIVVIAPHADDAELGAGGFIAKMCQKHPTLIVMCSGQEIPRLAYNTDEPMHMERFKQRVQEQTNAAKCLGPVAVACIRAMPENNFQLGDMSAFIDIIGKRYVKPSVTHFLVPLPSYNQDHIVTFEACMAALRPTRPGPKRIWAYEYPGTDFSHVHMPPGGHVYVPLSEREFGLKIGALDQHKSQMQDSGLFSMCGVTQMAEWRGQQCGSPHAERFVSLREIWE